PRRQDQDGKAARTGPPAVQHRQAIELRQSEIQYRCVVILDVAREPGSFAVANDVDGHSSPLQDRCDVVGDTGFILGEQDLHWSSPSPRMRTPAPASTSTTLRRPSAAMIWNR